MDTTDEPNVGHELLGDLQALASEAATVLGQAATGKSTEDGIATLRAQFDVAQARFSELCGEAKQKTMEGVRYTDQAVRRNPYTSIAIIAGAALIAGVLVGRATKTNS